MASPSSPNRIDEGVSWFGGLVLTLTALAAMYGLMVSLAWLYGLRHDQALAEASAHVQTDLLTLTLAQLCGMGGALFIGLRIFEPDAPMRETLHALPVRMRVLGLCLLAGAMLQFPLAELANVLHAYVFGPDPLEQQLAIKQMITARTMGEGVIIVLCLVAAVPMIEELFFRGFLLFGFAARYGNAAAVLTSACLFGVVHLGAVPALYAMVAGLVLGVLALATRSVWPGIALHAAVNAMPVLIPEHVLPIRGFNVPSPNPEHLPPWLVWPPLVASVLLLAWVRRIEYAEDR